MNAWIRLAGRFGIDRRFARYVLAGGTAFVVDYAVLVWLTSFLHVHYLASATVSFLLGSVVCYALSVGWVFDQRRYEDRRAEAVIFVLVGVCGLGLNNLILWACTDGAGIPYQASKLVAGVLVLCFNYSARRILLFTGRVGAPAGERHA